MGYRKVDSKVGYRKVDSKVGDRKADYNPGCNHETAPSFKSPVRKMVVGLKADIIILDCNIRNAHICRDCRR